MSISSTTRKIGINLGRLIVALTFLFSGYVKAIDPLGTQYKIADYLQALGLGGVIPDWLTLTASIGLSTLEFSIGIFLLFAIRRRLTSKVLLLVMAVMTFITAWIVIANPVKDCGCFGDALKLTNAETFAKNIVLLAISILLWKKQQFQPLPGAFHAEVSGKSHLPHCNWQLPWKILSQPQDPSLLSAPAPHPSYRSDAPP